MAGLKSNTVDLDTLLNLKNGLPKRANVGFFIGSTDISNTYADVDDSENFDSGPTTGFKTGATDIGTLFAKIDMAVTPGTLWTVGRNNTAGALGDGTQVDKSSFVQTIAGGTNWKFSGCATDNGMGIKTDGTLWAWGLNDRGQVGDNTAVNKSSPVQTVAGGTNWKRAGGGTSNGIFAALKTDGTAWTWGEALEGGLGDNSLVNKSSPVQISGGGTNWKQVLSGYRGGAALKTDGTVWCWGRGLEGQLGNNTATTLSSPVQTISGGTNWKFVAAGVFFNAAIKTDGTLWLWGINGFGSLGDNTIVAKSSPVQTVSGGTNWRFVAVGAENVAAVKTDGTLWCWGANAARGLGDGTQVDKSSPVQTSSGGTNWLKSAKAHANSSAIKTDKTLWVWGSQTTIPKLGVNDVLNYLTPVQVFNGGTTWQMIRGSNGLSVAIKT